MIQAEVMAHLVAEHFQVQAAVDPGFRGVAADRAGAQPATGVLGEGIDIVLVGRKISPPLPTWHSWQLRRNRTR